MSSHHHVQMILCTIVCLAALPRALDAAVSSASTTTRHAAISTVPTAVEKSIFAESALVDRETGRIFWEGGSKSTLSESLESRFGTLVYVKAAIVSVLLWIVAYGWIASFARQKIQSLDWIQTLQRNAPIAMAVCQFALLGGAVPRAPVWVLILVVLAYLVEAYLCSTHQFLAHRSDCQNVETFIEQLREETPKIQWKVRVFQYEPLWRSLWQDLRHRFLQLSSPAEKKTNDVDNSRSISTRPVLPSSPIASLIARKRILRQATGNFLWNEQGGTSAWQDSTTAGIWTRARGETDHAPLAKIHLTQVMVLGNRQAREEYFRQQGKFVKQHAAASSSSSAAAEFATHIEVPGYKPRVLVTRQNQWWCSRRVFWFCTLLGLSVLYRAWMARHCDVIRVSLVKETLGPQPRSWWSTYGSGSSSNNGDRSSKQRDTVGRSNNSSAIAFRSLMQQLEVYRPHPALPLLASNTEMGTTNATSSNKEQTESSAEVTTISSHVTSCDKEPNEILDLDPTNETAVQDSLNSTSPTPKEDTSDISTSSYVDSVFLR